MMSFGMDMVWRLLRGAAGMVIDTIGIGGVIAAVAGLILLLTLSARVTKFLGSRKGMAITAAVLVLGILFAGRAAKPSTQAASRSLPRLTAPARQSADVASLATEEEPPPEIVAETRPQMAAEMMSPIPDMGMGMMAEGPMLPVMPGGMGGPIHVPPVQLKGTQEAVTHHAAAKPSASVTHATVSVMPSPKPATHAGPAATGNGSKLPANGSAGGKDNHRDSAKPAAAGLGQSMAGNQSAGARMGGTGTPNVAAARQGRNIASANGHAASGMMGGMTPMNGMMPGGQNGGGQFGGNASAGQHLTAQQARRQAAMMQNAIANEQMNMMMGQMMQHHMGIQPMGGMHPGMMGHPAGGHPGMMGGHHSTGGYHVR